MYPGLCPCFPGISMEFLWKSLESMEKRDMSMEVLQPGSCKGEIKVGDNLSGVWGGEKVYFHRPLSLKFTIQLEQLKQLSGNKLSITSTFIF